MLVFSWRGSFSVYRLKQEVQLRMVSVVNLFRIFKIITFGFDVDICNLVHDMEKIVHLP